MKYTIKPGNIAACCYVTAPNGETETFIYMAADKLPATAPKDSTAEFLALPLAVRAAINKHYHAIFALPVEQRGAHLRNCVPFEVDAE